ncbi:MAG: hypothetical protein ACJA0S_001254 [Rickettsiales bacterium]|jgi:hypothetical protein
MKKAILAKILTLSGSLVFIFLTFLKFCGNDYFFKIEINSILIAYGAIILSFVSGMHFSYAILQDKIPIRLLIFSNIIALFAWCCLLMDFKLSLAILLLCYLFNILIDFIAHKNSIIEKWFFDLRLRISLIVMICLLINFWHTT